MDYRLASSSGIAIKASLAFCTTLLSSNLASHAQDNCNSFGHNTIGQIFCCGEKLAWNVLHASAEECV